MREYWRVVRTFDPSLVRCFAYWAVIGFCAFGIFGVLTNLYLLRLKFDLGFIGLLNGVGLFANAAFALPAAAIGRRIGLREAQVVALVFMGIAAGLWLAVEALPGEIWAPWLCVWMAVGWAGAALLGVNGVPYVMAVASEEARSYAFPVQGAITSGATLAGSLLAGVLPSILVGVVGGSLADTAPFRYSLCLVPVGYLLAALQFSRARSVKVAEDEIASASRSPAPLGLFALLGLSILLFGAGLGAANTFVNVYLDVDLHLDPAGIGAIMGLTQIAAIGTALMTPGLLARSGSAVTLVLATLGQAISLVLLGAVPTWGAAALGLLGVRAMGGIVNPSRNLFSQEMVVPHWRPTTSAILMIGSGLSSAVAAAAGGYLAGSIGFGGLFFVSAAFAAASTILVIVLERSAATATTRGVARQA